MNFFNKLFSKLERFIFSRWLNILATIYLNFRCLPLRQAIVFPIKIYGRPKFLELRGTIQFSCPVKYGLIEINNSHSDAPSFQGLQSELLIRGTVIFHGRGQIDTGTKIYVGANATLELGNRFKITDNVNIGCFQHISIGDTSRITHRCQVFDTNYHFLANINKGIIPPATRPIFIGRNVWIGNSSTVCSGAYIPDYTIVSSNSLVNKNFLEIPKYSLIGGIPARLISTGLRRIESLDLTIELYRYYDRTKEIYNLPKDLNETIYYEE